MKMIPQEKCHSTVSQKDLKLSWWLGMATWEDSWDMGQTWVCAMPFPAKNVSADPRIASQRKRAHQPTTEPFLHPAVPPP